MPVLLYPKGKEAILGSTNMLTDNIKCRLVTSAYTYSDAHQFLSQTTGGIGDSSNLASKSLTNGVFDANDVSIISTSTASAVAYILYVDSGTASTSQLLMYYDGIQIITIAANSSSSTAITVDPLTYAIANSAVLTRVSGTGPSTVTLSSSGGNSAGLRTLTASANQSMVQGDTYSAPISGTGLPVSVNNGQTVNISFDNGVNRIFAI